MIWKQGESLSGRSNAGFKGTKKTGPKAGEGASLENRENATQDLIRPRPGFSRGLDSTAGLHLVRAAVTERLTLTVAIAATGSPTTTVADAGIGATAAFNGDRDRAVGAQPSGIADRGSNRVTA